MDIERINAEARKFSEDGSCYIHCECKDGKHEIVITGDGRPIIVSLAAMIEQIATASHTNFKTILAYLVIEHEIEQDKEKEGIARTEATTFVLPKMPKNKNDSEE